MFRLLELCLGPQHWWPAENAFEVVVGAFLTQNTAWSNVEHALQGLRQADALSPDGIRRLSLEQLETLIRPAGYFRQKGARLQQFVAHLDARYAGSLTTMLAGPLPQLRQELLALPGIGPETADAILLYAGSREVFVVDAYTRRIFQRHGLAEASDDYEAIRTRVEAALGNGQHAATSATQKLAQRWHEANPNPPHRATQHRPSGASQLERSERARQFSEFHAQLVQLAKHYCLKREARCADCPLRPLLPPDSPSSSRS